jgi:hypothetical protein
MKRYVIWNVGETGIVFKFINFKTDARVLNTPLADTCFINNEGIFLLMY